MPGEAEHGKQFARDLCGIRRARGVSLTDMHEATRMAYDLIKRFEHDALIGHPQFNRVYIRLFVREYATCVDIDAERAMEAFERAMQGKYDGSLAREYLEEADEAPSEKEPREKRKARTKSSGSGRKEGAALSAKAEPAPSEPSSEKSGDPEAALPADSPPPPSPPAPVASSSEKASAPALSVRMPVSPAASGKTGERSPFGSSRASEAGERPFAEPTRKLDARWIFLGLLIAAVGLVIWNLTRAMSGAEAPDTESSSALSSAGSDSFETATAASALPPLPLPDTLDVEVVADKGSVAPIRVTLDEDLRRPYWIERGDSRTFRMANRIILEQQLDSVTVRVEGVAYPLSPPAGQDSVILTRAALDAWFFSVPR